MHRIGVFCAALAVSVLARPVAAQQSALEQQPAPTDQSQQTQPPPLPPFPPMPHHAVRSSQQASPHEHYPGSSEHHLATHSRHHATHHRTTTREHHHATHHHPTGHHATHEHHHAPVHLSKRTISQCHKMSYKQIMRNSNCRALMMQDLEAHEARHSTKHKKSSHPAKHHSTKHHATTHHHNTTHHR